MRSLRVLLATLLLIPFAAAEKAATMPAPAGYVDDYAGVMTAGGRSRIDAICHEVHLKTKAQIFVVTIKSLEGESIETFANDLFHRWKIGEKKTDRGILVLLAVGDHKRRIEVGYGLEGILPDARVGEIGREMVPSLQVSNYDAATLIAVKAIADTIAEDAKVSLSSTADAPAPVLEEHAPPPVAAAPPSSQIGHGGDVAMGVMMLMFFGVFGLIIWAIVRRRHAAYGSGPGYGPGYYDPGANTYTNFGSSDNNSSSNAIFSGGSDSSSSSDSFSGGDGGDSGGGGASGDW